MTQTSNPKVTVNVSGAPTPIPNAAMKILAIGQQTSAGTATDGELITGLTKATAKTLGGAGGMMYDVVDDMLDIFPDATIDAIFLDDPTGAAAVGNILWDGTVTTAGTLTVGYGHFEKGVATVGLTVGQTSDNVATAVTAAYALLTDCTATVATDGVTTDQNNFTYNHDGTEGNNQPLWFTFDGAGITGTITAPTGGSGVPTMTNVLDAVGTGRYQRIVAPGSYGVSYLATHLDANFNVDNAVRDGAAVVCVLDTAANHVTALGSINSKSVDYLCEAIENKSWYKGANGYIGPFAKAARIVAIDAMRLSDGVNVSNYVATSAPNDLAGGPHMASKPYFGTPIYTPVTENGFGFTDTQVTSIENAGGFIVGNNSANTAVVLGQRPTTYKTDISGNVDLAFKYRNYVDTYSQVREYIFNNVKRDCNQARLTEGGLIGGYAMENDLSIKQKILRYEKTLSGDGYVLVESGADAAKFMEANTAVTLTKSIGRARVNTRVPVVTQLRELIINIAFTFSVNG